MLLVLLRKNRRRTSKVRTGFYRQAQPYPGIRRGSLPDKQPEFTFMNTVRESINNDE